MRAAHGSSYAGGSGTPPDLKVAAPRLVLGGARADPAGSIALPPAERIRRFLVSAAVFVVAIAAAIAVLSGLNGGTASVQRAAPPPAGLLARVTLSAASADPTARGHAAVVRDRGRLTLIVAGGGLPPNAGNVYAVWLTSSYGESQLLGLISPPVGGSGDFTTGLSLRQWPRGAQQLLITAETTVDPLRPGVVLLSGPAPTRP